MNATARREKNKQELRSQILAAAREIFVRHGYEGFSMRKLARKIEYSPGSIYLHFRNKEELFRSLVDDSFAQLLEELKRLGPAGHAGLLDELKVGLRTYIAFGLSHPNEYRIAFLLAPAQPKGPYKPHPAFEILRTMVRRCVREGALKKVDVETVSQSLWATAHGITSLLIQRPMFPWVEREALIAQVINGAVDSLAKHPRHSPSGGNHGHSIGAR
jgi:AcrR family transcriptional regulator